MDCVTVVENLSQREKNSILHVLQRDEELRTGQEQKVSNLRREVNLIRTCSVLRAGDDQSKMCLRCRAEFGLLFNRGTLCPSCKYKVCKTCQEVMFNGSWLCKLCYKQRQLKWLTGEWATSFEQNPLRKWASGSDIMKASLQLVPGTTSIDIDESTSNQGNSKQGRKVSKNGVGGSDQGRTRVEVPKEGDQLKLSELFSVLRVKKSDEQVSQETQVRRVTSRKYSESDSDSSSNSDIDIRSTAPSVTESELDGHRTDSPRGIESPLPKINESRLTFGVTESPRLFQPVKQVESPEHRPGNETHRPIPAPSSPKPAARRKVRSEHFEHEDIKPSARPRTKDRKIQDRKSQGSERLIEGQVSMSKEVQITAGRQIGDLEPYNKTSIHSELSLHVANTRESLDKKYEVEKSRSQASLDSRGYEPDSVVRQKSKEQLIRQKSKEQLIRKSADNLSKESKHEINADKTLLNKSDNQLDKKCGADTETKTSASNSDVVIKSSKFKGSILVDESETMTNQKEVDTDNHKTIDIKNSGTKEQSNKVGRNAGDVEPQITTQRAGSPYSISMDSLPSSHPSPTLLRCSLSSNPESDTDSVSRSTICPIVEQSQSPNMRRKADKKDDFVVEQISKVHFKRVSKRIGQLGVLAKMSMSPNKNKSTEVGLVVEQRETQSRGGSGLREERGSPRLASLQTLSYNSAKVKTGDAIVSNNSSKTHSNTFVEDKLCDNDDDNIIEEDMCIEEVKSDKVSSSCAVTDLMKKLLNMDAGRSRGCQSKSTEGTKSMEELIWINEYEAENSDTLDDELRSSNRLPKLMTSSLASDCDRKPSEADSIEDMIDDMTRAQLFSETTIHSVRNSETDSDIGLNLTPISPFPQELYEIRSGKYNRFAYISDDNLDADSADDTDDITVNEQSEAQRKYLKETNLPSKKKVMNTMGSLDLLLDEQGDFVDGNQEVIELDKEYHDALEFTREENTGKPDSATGRKDSSNGSDIKMDEIERSPFKELHDKERKSTVGVGVEEIINKMIKVDPRDIAYYKESNNEDIPLSSNEMVEPISTSFSKCKPKLTAQSSLDILLDQQGDFVDPDLQNVEFDADLLATLEKQFSEHLAMQNSSPAHTQEYAFLGVQHRVRGVADAYMQKSSVENSPKQDDFDTIVGDAKDYLYGTIDSNITEKSDKPKHRCIECILQECSPESSDSDMLSVIDEVDERDTSDDSDKEIYTCRVETKTVGGDTVDITEVNPFKKKETRTAQEQIDIKCFAQPVTVDENQVFENTANQAVDKIRTDLNKHSKSSTHIKGNIYRKVTDMEKKVQNLNKGNRISRTVDNKMHAVNNQEKYKKIHRHWLAIENHEADILDTEEYDKDVAEESEMENHVLATNAGNTNQESKAVEQYSMTLETKSGVKIQTQDVDIYLPESTDDGNEEAFIRETYVTNESNQTDIDKQDDIIERAVTSKELTILADSANVHDVSTEDKRTVRTILNSTINDNCLYMSASIDDSNILCHSISDMSSLTSSGFPDTSLINKSPASEADTHKTDIRASRDCTSLPEIEIPVELEQSVKYDCSDLRTSINDSTSMCNSISELQSPLVHNLEGELGGINRHTCISAITDTCDSLSELENIVVETETMSHSGSAEEVLGHHKTINIHHDTCDSIPDIEGLQNAMNEGNICGHTKVTTCRSLSDGPVSLYYNVPDDVETCYSIDEHPPDFKDDVFDSKLAEAEPNMQPSVGISIGTEFRRLNSDEIRIEIKAMQKSQKMYKSEVELQVDKSGRVTPPGYMSNNPMFFKAPERPPRTKKSTPSSSVPDSPEISADYPQGYMEIPRSEKLSTLRDSPQTSECSVSQDDSGNVSGGSRGTTPEHKRTDSSYSQSSLPSSTLSTVTDDDEDIDCIVAKVQKQANSRGNLLSVFGDSRESLASYYSDAGDIAYSNIPITGEILFSLSYNYKTSMLEVGIKQCRNIAVADTKRRRTDPYVKTYMLPDRTRGGKRKTKVKKHATSPTFDETLKYSITKSELENRTLWVTVWHNDRFGRNVFLGEVTINFDYYKFDDPFPRWYPLQERMDAPPPSMMVYKGDLSVSVRFVPANKLGASAAPSGKQKESGKGQLQVMIKEARNLTAVRSNGFSDPFCKGYLLPERHKSSKQKTNVMKKDCNPVWDHTFNFEDVTLMELRERCLELTIWDYEKLTSNDFLGGVRLNLGTGVSQGKVVEWMDARGEEMSMWQAMLDRPNVWIEGALILRPNMNKRKF